MSRFPHIASRFSLLAAFLLLGAGCSASIPQQLQTVKLPTAGSVIARIQGIPEHWSQIGVTLGTSTVRIAFPGTLSTVEGSQTDQVLQADMGTAVLDPKDLTVPTRSLRVFVVPKDDKRMKNCAFSEVGWNNGPDQETQKNLKFGEVPLTFCRHSQSDAALGNRYAMHSFAAPIGNQVLVLEFVVHSVVCENFEKPTEQCVPYDEKRDTAIFPEILSQVRVE
jgi:hypothetical protein